MEQTVIDESRLKEIMKMALIEVFDQRRNVFYDVIAEALEDIALAHAIKEGETTKSISRAEVFKILESKT